MPAIATRREPRSGDPLPAADYLELPVREFMTPGVIAVVEDASLRQAYRALVVHRVHAILVLGRQTGRPLGWVTMRGLLGWVGRDESMAFARDAVTEAPQVIEPAATAREAVVRLSQPDTTRLLVCHRPDALPEGVVTEADVVALAAR